MIKKVTEKELPILFENIIEFSIDTECIHRKNSNFWRTDIIQFEEKDSEYFPDIKNFSDYVGLWKTNKVIYDDDGNFDENFSELTRVEKIEKTIVVIEYVEL